MDNPYITAREPHYAIDESARRLKMPVGALVERINAGEVEVKYNGRGNFISAGEIARVSVNLRREAQAAQAAEQEQATQEVREKDGAHIARLMSEAQGIAAKYGYDPTTED